MDLPHPSGNQVPQRQRIKGRRRCFSLNRLIQVGEGYAYLFSSAWPLPKQPMIHLKITLEYHLRPLLSTLCRLYILEKDLVMKNKIDGPYGEYGDYGKEWLLTHDAGSGPYITYSVAVQESYKAVRFDSYWAGFAENAPDGFEIINQSEAATIRSMMANKEIEITDSWQTEAAITALDAMSGVNVNTYMTGHLMYMMLNNQGAPTDDIHFRKALSYCLDYETAASLFPGSKVPNGPISSVLAGWNKSLPTMKQDLDKAREELAQSKYASQLDKYPVTLYWVSEVADEEKLALRCRATPLNRHYCVRKAVPGQGLWISSVAKGTPNIPIIHVDPYNSEAGSVLSRSILQLNGYLEQAGGYAMTNRRHD